MTDRPRALAEHLEELRWRLIRCLCAFAVGTVIGFGVADRVLGIIVGTTGVPHLAMIRVAEGFGVRMDIAMALGVALSFPAVLYEAVAFVWPALERHERRYLLTFLPLSVALFAAGVGFAFLIVLPAAVGFFLRFAGESLQPVISVRAYVSFVLGLVLPFGFVFQLPVVAGVLTRLGVISPAFLSRSRKYAVLVVFVVAAVMTPPDVVSQLMLATPLLLLCGASEVVSRLTYRFLQREARKREVMAGSGCGQ